MDTKSEKLKSSINLQGFSWAFMVVMHPTLIPTTMESEKSYLINWKDLKDKVDGRIDESIQKIDGRLVIATDHGMHETTSEEEVM
ncbi:hypothetical protein R3W88_006401 [Solanum pinnatisectum]|uniref:Uncharacterized protein n=1 Tax=Solanum pinnatisectum TaxID=50273 RepID=A0AAV9KFL8_9SOLN|nr:hypothetical protein R3W88_006401 [Solanum pinnatisectum]